MRTRHTVALPLLCFGVIIAASCSDTAPPPIRPPPDEPLPAGTNISGGDTTEALDAIAANWQPSLDPDYNNLTPRPGVEAATKAQTDDVTVTATELVFPRATHPEVLTWKPGRIVVAGPGAGAGKNPMGFARRVVSVAEQGANIVVTTEIPVLQELFEGDVQMTFDPDKAQEVDLTKLDLEWAAENLYANVDFSSESPGVLTDSFPLEAGDVGEDGMSLPPAMPGDPGFGWLAKAAKSGVSAVGGAIGGAAKAIASASTTVWKTVTAKSFDGSIPLDKEISKSVSQDFLDLDYKKTFNPSGKLPLELGIKGNAIVSGTLAFNPKVQVGFTVPGLGSIGGDKPFALWINADSCLRASEKIDLAFQATLESAGGKSGVDLENLFKEAPTTRAEVETHTKEFFLGHPDLKPGTAWTKTIFISKPMTQTVAAGPVPVVFTETFQLDLECGLQAQANITAVLETEQSLTFKYSARYENGAVTSSTPQVKLGNKFNIQVLAGGSLVATCGLIPRINAFIYDTIGLNAGLRASIIGRASYTTSCENAATTWKPEGEVKLGLSTGLGLKVGARGQVPGSSFLGTSGTALGATWYPPELFTKEFPLYEDKWSVLGLGYCTPTCTNAAQDDLETDTDCGGGQCNGCAEGEGCSKNSDCAVGFCAAGKCSNTDHCQDGIIDGDETATDCGGALCDKCPLGRACLTPSDCKSGFCKVLPGSGSSLGFCVADPCEDNTKNNGECGADCGGSCNACALGAYCNIDAECATGASNGYRCVDETCKDLKLSPGESDIDCGAACFIGCAQGQRCFQDADCADGTCIAGICENQWLSSCAERRAADPEAADGDYKLYVGGDPQKPWTAYCHDMAGTPTTYLTLVNTTNANYSQYTAGGASPGTDVRTSFTKVRIDPATLQVDPNDLTFSTSTGSLNHGDAIITSVPYGSAVDCLAEGSSSGVGNVDLTGVPFVVAPDQFAVAGFMPSGNTTYGAGGRTVHLTGGGYCGWTTVRGGSPIHAVPPLQLVYALVAPATSFKDAKYWSSNLSDADGWGASEARYRSIQYADLNADNRDDVCGRDVDGIHCALSTGTEFGALAHWSNGYTDPGWTPDAHWKTIRFADLNGDGKADVCGRGGDGIICGLSTGAAFAATSLWTTEFSNTNGWSGGPAYYETIQFPDLNGDGKADICGRHELGMRCALSTGTEFGASSFWSNDYSDAAGWASDMHWKTIRFADLNGDGKADVCGRGGDGMICGLSTGTAFAATSLWTTDFSNDKGWSGGPAYYETIQFPDLNGDGSADVCGREEFGIRCALSTGTAFGASSIWVNAYADAGNWSSQPYYWATIRFPDINGDGKADVCGRGANQVLCAVSSGTAFTSIRDWDLNYTDSNAWNANASRWSTIRFPDINGDGSSDICGRNVGGLFCGLALP
ncbi:FG-GAP-like repeat-containing protein [Sorangium sp. So ce1097]|uniref:FG-GAP-like repeat-containing protein n=1 Tax=Sorangium sp. So ce1097 TaxID=3133330 RepID=UPI003F5FE736